MRTPSPGPRSAHAGRSRAARDGGEKLAARRVSEIARGSAIARLSRSSSALSAAVRVGLRIDT
eukprot:5958573-Prymnesium_polylepis.1